MKRCHFTTDQGAARSQTIGQTRLWLSQEKCERKRTDPRLDERIARVTEGRGVWFEGVGIIMHVSFRYLVVK